MIALDALPDHFLGVHRQCINTVQKGAAPGLALPDHFCAHQPAVFQLIHGAGLLEPLGQYGDHILQVRAFLLAEKREHRSRFVQHLLQSPDAPLASLSGLPHTHHVAQLLVEQGAGQAGDKVPLGLMQTPAQQPNGGNLQHTSDHAGSERLYRAEGLNPVLQ